VQQAPEGWAQLLGTQRVPTPWNVSKQLGAVTEVQAPVLVSQQAPMGCGQLLGAQAAPLVQTLGDIHEAAGVTLHVPAGAQQLPSGSLVTVSWKSPRLGRSCC